MLHKFRKLLCAEGDAVRLHILNVLQDHDVDAANRRQALAERLEIHRACRDLAEITDEGLMLAVVWSGRDCDGVQYQGDVRLVRATWRAVMDHIEHTLEWADGPCSYSLMTPSAAAKLRYWARDTILEAFEDGHPHCIHA